MPSKRKIPFPEFHSEVNKVSKSLYESGHFTDALRSASIRLEESCKQILKDKTGREETGTTLMAKLFCENRDGKVLFPIINMGLQDSSDKQKSYYFLFSGFTGAVRNQLAHSTDPLDDIEALYGLNMVSYLFYKLDRAKEMNIVQEVLEQEAPQLVQTDNSIESSIITLLLLDGRITEISSQTQDQSIAKLSIQKVSEDIIIEQLNTIGENTYNYYFDHKNTIILSLLSSLYEQI